MAANTSGIEFPLNLPPGMKRSQVVSDSVGRWYDGNLVRWRDGLLQPWGGWTDGIAGKLWNGSAPAKPIRGLFGWRSETAPTTRLAIGTYQGAYSFFPNDVDLGENITPAAGFTSGREHAGSGIEASAWIFDAWDEDLLGVMYEDGVLWRQPGATPTANFAAAAGAPAGNSAVVVTPEKFVMLLGVSREPGRIDWCDQDDITTWTAAEDNQAGSWELPGGRWLMNGKRGIDETLLWTDTDLWAARYIGGTLVYSFKQVGFACGPASRRAMTMVDGKAIWMGRRGFFGYDGFTKQIPCEVAEYVFNRINYDQISKVVAWANPEFGEVTWFYPGSQSANAECDSYVTYDYINGIWYLGSLNRTDGIERGFFAGPYCGNSEGEIYKHETGTTYADVGGPTSTPYADSGPLRWQDGRRLFHAMRYIPDGKTTTGVTVTLYGKMYPTGSETTYGPYTAANPTDLRVHAKEIRVKLTQSTAGWRFGAPSLEIVPGGYR